MEAKFFYSHTYHHIICNIIYNILWAQGKFPSAQTFSPGISSGLLPLTLHQSNFYLSGKSHQSNFLHFVFIVFIHVYSASYSMSLSEALPTTSIDHVYVRVYMPKRYSQL